eukprot:gb/GECG01010101.1/.p1 GENE.gb/GECG01010101.1/~~gb/GECG01010101.1/.p1  ORF type:complete len:163 (+),score=13.79 gb/GECG01010101.1/:1-489(+)
MYILFDLSLEWDIPCIERIRARIDGDPKEEYDAFTSVSSSLSIFGTSETDAVVEGDVDGEKEDVVVQVGVRVGVRDLVLVLVLAGVIDGVLVFVGVGVTLGVGDMHVFAPTSYVVFPAGQFLQGSPPLLNSPILHVMHFPEPARLPVPGSQILHVGEPALRE